METMSPLIRFICGEKEVARSLQRGFYRRFFLFLGRKNGTLLAGIDQIFPLDPLDAKLDESGGIL